jgi:curved DNA-binding protein CbpA
MPQDRLDRLDYYTLLGVEPTATEDEINLAFQIFALKYHPDRYPQNSPFLERAGQIYRRGTEAYRALSDHRLRACYDHDLEKGALRLDRAKARLQTQIKVKKEPEILTGYLRPLLVQADKAIAQKDFQQAERMLVSALGLDKNNQEVKNKLKEVRERLKKKK